MSGWAADLLLGGIILVGASVQRLAGIGFALVAVPALVLLFGPVEGVVLSNCAAGAISAIGLATEWRQVRLAAMLPLVIAAGCTVPMGTLVVAHLPGPVLMIGMGMLVSTAVLLVMWGTRVPALRGTKGALAAGAASGFMNSSAGVGGPAVTLYAVNAGRAEGVRAECAVLRGCGQCILSHGQGGASAHDPCLAAGRGRNRSRRRHRQGACGTGAGEENSVDSAFACAGWWARHGRQGTYEPVNPLAV